MGESHSTCIHLRMQMAHQERQNIKLTMFKSPKSQMLPRCLFWSIQWTQCRLKFWNIHVSIHVCLRSKQERRRSYKQRRIVTLQKFLQHSDIDCTYCTKSFVNSDTILIKRVLFNFVRYCAHDTLSSCRITKAFALLFRTPVFLHYSCHDLSMFSLSLVPSSKSHMKSHGGRLVSATCR